MFVVNNPGVTVLTESPSAGAVPTTEMDTEPFGDETDIVPARKTSRQDSVSVAWGKASEKEHIAGICEPFNFTLRAEWRNVGFRFQSML